MRRQKQFYDSVLGVLGYTGRWTTRSRSATARTAFHTSGSPTAPRWDPIARSTWRSRPPTPTRCKAFYDTALKLGAESLHEPRLWPEYHPGYFGAFVRDPDGNNVEAVFHGAAPSDSA